MVARRHSHPSPLSPLRRTPEDDVQQVWAAPRIPAVRGSGRWRGLGGEPWWRKAMEDGVPSAWDRADEILDAPAPDIRDLLPSPVLRFSVDASYGSEDRIYDCLSKLSVKLTLSPKSPASTRFQLSAIQRFTHVSPSPPNANATSARSVGSRS